MPSGIKKLHACAFWGDYRRMSLRILIFPCQAVTEKRWKKGIRYRSGVHSYRIRIPKGLQLRVCRSSLTLACRPLSRHFRK
jgi:hypothetical protein